MSIEGLYTRYANTLLVVLLVWMGTSGCAHRPNPHNAASALGDVQPVTTIEGTLVDARCYILAGEPRGDRRFCSFVGMSESAPAALVTSPGRLVFLAINSHELAKYAGSRVRLRGTALYSGTLLRPEAIWVTETQQWMPIVQATAPNEQP